MKYRPLGKSGLEASVIGLGTWVTGGGTVWGKDVDDSESIRAIQASHRRGDQPNRHRARVWIRPQRTHRRKSHPRQAGSSHHRDQVRSLDKRPARLVFL